MDKNLKKDKKKDEEEVLDEVLEEKDEIKNEEKVESQFENKINDLEEQLKRAVADYRNLERRGLEERVEARKYANKHLIEALLPAFDTLFLAGKYTKDESVRLTINRILEILKENGIEKIGTEKVQYNAETMEAVEIVEGNENEVEVNDKEGGKVDVEGEEKWNIRNKVNQNDHQILNPDANSNSDNHLDNNSANSFNIDDEINTDGSRTLDPDLQHALNLLTMDPTQLLTAVKERKYIF